MVAEEQGRELLRARAPRQAEALPRWLRRSTRSCSTAELVGEPRPEQVATGYSLERERQWMQRTASWNSTPQEHFVPQVVPGWRTCSCIRCCTPEWQAAHTRRI